MAKYSYGAHSEIYCAHIPNQIQWISVGRRAMHGVLSMVVRFRLC